MTLARQLTLAMVSVAVFTGALVTGFVGYGVTQAVEPMELAHLKTRLHAEIAGLQGYVAGARADTLAAVEAAPLGALLSAHAQGLPARAAEHETAVAIFRALLDAKPHYLQLRLIAADDAGRELIRVERAHAGGPVRVVPDRALQNKGERPYVVEGLKVRGRHVYVSPIELNQELGQIAVPHIPVLRTAATSPNADGRPAGLVVLNVDMGPALSVLQSALKPVTRAVYLFDRDGNFLIHPDPSKVFGRDLGTGEGLTRSFPALTHLLRTKEPWVGKAHAPGRKDTRHLAIPFSVLGGPQLVLLAGDISTATVAARGAQRTVVTVALLAVALALVAALLLSRTVTRPLAVMTRLAEHYPDTAGEPLPLNAAGELGTLARALARMDNQVRERNELLQEQEARFRRMFEAGPHAALTIDGAQRIVLANARAEALFGYARQELIGQELALLVPAAVRERHRGDVAEFIDKPSTRAMAMGRTFEIQRKDGSPAHVEIGLAPLASAKVNEVLASIVDVSGRVRNENALRQSNRELEQFAYVASHDLQEPLRMVANYTELLARRYEGKLDAKADKYIRYAVDGARRMQRLISDLLAYSRVTSQGGSFARVDLNVTLQSVQDALQVKIAETGAQIDVQPLPIVSADVTQMQQLFQNVLDNAIKFHSEQAPKIIISATDEPHNPERTCISVRDNGIGIDMQNAERLFQMFQRGHARDRYGGTGIGLAVSKRVIERHGGRIWVEPTPGGGSTFYFTLPLAAPGRTA